MYVCVGTEGTGAREHCEGTQAHTHHNLTCPHGEQVFDSSW